MKLYGSLTNRLMEAGSKFAGPVHVLGMAATTTSYSDRKACTVVAFNGKILTVQQDKATRVDQNGMSDSQEYDYAPDPGGKKTSFRKNRGGAWEEVYYNGCETRRWRKVEGGFKLILGVRDEYYDYSF